MTEKVIIEGLDAKQHAAAMEREVQRATDWLKSRRGCAHAPDALPCPACANPTFTITFNARDLYALRVDVRDWVEKGMVWDLDSDEALRDKWVGLLRVFEDVAGLCHRQGIREGRQEVQEEIRKALGVDFE